MNDELYPLKFKPTYHYRIWGGNGLQKYAGKDISNESIGESWEISTVPGFISVVENGSWKGENLIEIIEKFQDRAADFLGTDVVSKFGNTFPLLIKFLDAEAPLSVQVHPDDEYAKEMENSFGKTEMWYIMRAEKDSELIIGFEQDTTKSLYQEKLQQNDLESVLRTVHPEKGDVFFIPAGRVHAIGKGITLAEIQQNSDITYRIYDYNRIDKDGKTRELHTDQALEVSDFNFVNQPQTDYPKQPNTINSVVNCNYFNTSYLKLDKEWQHDFEPDSFTVYMGVSGNAEFLFNDKIYSLNLGETLLIPAGIKKHTISPKEHAEILMVRV